MNDILLEKEIVKFIKSPRLRWYGHVERMQNQRMPKQIATSTMNVTMKRGKPSKRWRDEVEKDLNVMGIKNRQATVRDHREWRKIVLEGLKGLSFL
jgi:hypothetical protein